MRSITNGTDCGSLGDYLAWNASQWETNKDFVRHFEIDIKDLCFYSGSKRFIKVGEQSQTDAINTCSKLGKGRLPEIESDEAYDEYYEFVDIENIYMQTVENKNRIFDKQHTLPYKYIGAKNSYLNLYEDYEFNTTSPRIQQWQIDEYIEYDLEIAQVSRKDRFGPGISWYLRRLNGYKCPAICETHGPILFFLMGVCESSFLWKFTNYPFDVENDDWNIL